MRFPRFRWRRFKAALMSLFAWFMVYGVVLAKPAIKVAEKKSSTTGSGPYVMAYLLIILATTLGMLFVCRSSNRPRPRPPGSVWEIEGYRKRRRRLASR